jgi:hypothetical protein
MVEISNEVKLAIIKDQFNDVMMTVKMLITMQPTFEAQRQFMSGELEGEWRDVVESEEFKEIYQSAAQAFNEVLSNLITFVDNIAKVYDFSFADGLPTNQEDFKKMSSELAEQVEKYNEVNEHGSN